MGSRVTCNPIPEGADKDILVLVEDLDSVSAEMCDGGGIPSMKGCSEFFSVREGDLNFIFTENPIFYSRFLQATALAKALNLLEKSERIILFQAILYGKMPRINEAKTKETQAEAVPTDSMGEDD